MTEHPEWIDPVLAAKRCTPREIEVARLRNMRMSWTTMVTITGRSRGEIQREWGSANRKVNGGYVPPKDDAATKRAIAVTDPDIILGLRGMPTVGLSRPGAGIVPGQPTRSGK